VHKLKQAPSNENIPYSSSPVGKIHAASQATTEDVKVWQQREADQQVQAWRPLAPDLGLGGGRQPATAGRAARACGVGSWPLENPTAGWHAGPERPLDLSVVAHGIDRHPTLRAPPKRTNRAPLFRSCKCNTTHPPRSANKCSPSRT
jgi:hypothetical protein